MFHRRRHLFFLLEHGEGYSPRVISDVVASDHQTPLERSAILSLAFIVIFGLKDMQAGYVQQANRDREGPHGLPPPTPPDIRGTFRRFGRVSQGETSPQPERASPGVPAASSSQRPSIARPPAGALRRSTPAATPPDRSAFGPLALRLSLSVSPPFSLGVPHEPRLRRAYDALC